MTFVWFGNANKLIGEAARPSLEQVTAHLLATVKDSHVKGFGWRTGELARSYTYAPDGNGFVVGTDMHYAPHVEFGTVNMPAQAHLRRAAAETANRFMGVTYQGHSS